VSIANPLIAHDLDLSSGEIGLLLSAFAWSYGLAQLPGGLLVDRFGARRILGVGLVVWSLAQMSSAFVATLNQFLAARAALGLGEAPMYTGGTRVCSDWYPERQRTLPVAIFNASSSLGPAIAPALLTALMAAFGWRWMFGAIGVAGIAVAMAWVALYRSPEAVDLSAHEQTAIGLGPAVSTSAPALRNVGKLLRQRTTWAMSAGFVGVIYMTWLYATWLPGYLEGQRHVSVTAAGFLTSIPLAAGFFGALSGGFVCNVLRHRGLDVRNACREPVVWAMAGTAVFTVAAALAPSTWAALALLSGGVFLANLASSCGWALGAVMAPPAEVGTLEAIQNIGGSVGGALAPVVTGFAVEVTGSFVPAFYLAAAVAAVSAVIYWVLGRMSPG
jgi:MFS family permease